MFTHAHTCTPKSNPAKPHTIFLVVNKINVIMPKNDVAGNLTILLILNSLLWLQKKKTMNNMRKVGS